jgi:phospholipid-translocating ATPase
MLAIGICFLNGFHGDWRMFTFRVILLLSSIIPISLRVNLDLAKLWYSYCINVDEGIKGAIARNSNIPEELGRIQFLISDKTGTLTQNDMICKRICTEYAQFQIEENKKDLNNLLEVSCLEFPNGPAQDYKLN